MSTAKLLGLEPDRRSSLERHFDAIWKMCSDITSTVPQPVMQFLFNPNRKFRYDLAWPDQKLLIDLEGGIYQKNSGHRNFHGTQRDMEKSNLATLMGYRVLRYSTVDLEKQPRQVVEQIVQLLKIDSQ